MVKRKSQLEESVLNRIRWAGMEMPEREFRFHPQRRWRFDFAWPDRKLAVECEGGIFSFGRHTRGAAYSKDCEKYNQSALLGWTVLRYTIKNLDQMIHDLKGVGL